MAQLPLQRPALAVLAAFPLALLLGVCAAVSSLQAQDLVFQPAPPQSDMTSRQLLDVTGAGGRLVAAGASGLVLYSDDGGRGWSQAAVPVSATLTALAFPTAEDGWAVGHGGVILNSGDGGANWTLQFDGRQAIAMFKDYATARREMLEAELETMNERDDADPQALEDLEIAVEDAIFAEEDAGLAIETGPADPFLDVAFRDAQHGFAVGAYGMFYRTQDGGQSWQLHMGALDNPYRYHLYAILIRDEQVYIAGEAGLLFRSDDGGESFERFYDVYDGSLFGLLPLGDGVVSYGLRGNVFLQARGSDDWTPVTTGNDTSLYGGGALDDGTILLLGAGGQLVRLGADGSAALLQHPGRTTLSAAWEAGDGTVWLVGLEGLMKLEEATAQ